jgi:hypothetical protein
MQHNPTHHDAKPHHGKQRDHSDASSNPPSQTGDEGRQDAPTGDQMSQPVRARRTPSRPRPRPLRSTHPPPMSHTPCRTG